MPKADRKTNPRARSRLAARRNAAGFTQQSLADHMQVARSTIVRWESGKTEDMRPSLRLKLSDALAVSPDELEFLLLIPAGGSVEADDDWQGSAVGTVVNTAEHQGDRVNRREFMALAGTAFAGAIVRPGAVLQDLTLVLVDHAPGVDPKSNLSVAALTDGLAQMKTAYQACNYQVVANELPDLLSRAKAGAQYLVGDDRLQLAAIDAQLHHVAASVLLKLDGHALASVAADRSMAAAQRSEDPLMVAASARIVTHTLMAAGHHEAAHRYAQTQAETLEADLQAPDTDALSVYGALLLRGAVAAGMAEDSATARTLLDEAERAGERVTGPANHHWTAFSLDNVLAHRLAVEILLGNAGTAIEHLQRIRLDNLGIAERKATVCIDAARAYVQWGKHDRAVSALLAAEQVSPAELRVRPVTRELVQQIWTIGPASARSDLAALVERVGIAA